MGRRTNLDAIILALGSETRNKKSEMSDAYDLAGQNGHLRGRTIVKPTVPLAHEEVISELLAESVCKGTDITKQGMIDDMNQGGRD